MFMIFLYFYGIFADLKKLLWSKMPENLKSYLTKSLKSFKYNLSFQVVLH